MLTALAVVPKEGHEVWGPRCSEMKPHDAGIDNLHVLDVLVGFVVAAVPR